MKAKKFEKRLNLGEVVSKHLTSQPRAGWEKACIEMTTRGDDMLLDADSQKETSWERLEWKW